MFYETVDLYRHFSLPRPQGARGTLTLYCRETKDDLAPKRRPAMLVIAGGGYEMVSARESEPVALRFLAEGYCAFTLDYSVGKRFPVPLVEGAMAMAFIRENAQRFGIEAGKTGAVGFSAGGHLAGMLATLYGEPAVREALGARAELVRPDAVLLCYPVITAGKFAHDGSFGVLAGKDPDLRRKLSLEERVTAGSSPAFLWHTADDGCVPVENSLLYAAACREAGVPFELHVFESGPHGASLASAETESGEVSPAVARLGEWFPLALGFLRQRGFAVRPR